MKKIIRFVGLAGVAGCMVLLSGCAFGTRNINLAHISVDSNRMPIGIDVSVPEVEDLRTLSTEVGSVRNGWGMKTAAVKCGLDVPAWVRKSLVENLQRAGVNVVPFDAASDAPVIQVVLNEFYCDSMMQYNAEVRIGAEIRIDGNTRFRGNYMGEAKATNWAATSSGFETTLNKAAQECFNRMIPELVRELEVIKNSQRANAVPGE